MKDSAVIDEAFKSIKTATVRTNHYYLIGSYWCPRDGTEVPHEGSYIFLVVNGSLREWV